MKKIIFAIAFLISLNSFAQETEGTTHHALAVNGTLFMKQFFNITSSSTVSLSPILANYRYNTGVYGFSFGMGGNQENSTEIDNQTSEDIRIKDSRWDFVLGFDKEMILTPRFSVHCGLDILWGNETQLTERLSNSGFGNLSPAKERITTSRGMSMFGLGPALGIEFKFHKFISLATNSSIHYQSSKTDDKTEFSVNFDDNESTTTKADEIKFNYPINLFFIVKF